MDKKSIVKMLFKEVALKDGTKPLLEGVHFEKERCYATDTHLLVIYNVGDERFAGKTINQQGEEIKGKYPPVDRVIPKSCTQFFGGDKSQLLRALTWWSRQKDHHPDDRVVIGTQTFMISSLRRLLNVFSIYSELTTGKLWLNEQGRPAKMESEMFTAIVMPCAPVPEENVDDERSFESPVTVSYANLINTFALESTRPKEATPAAFDWL